MLASNFDGNIQREINELQKFATFQDIELMLSMTYEFAVRGHSTLALVQLDRTKTRVDPQYNEALPTDRKWKDPIEFLADVDLSPDTKTLKKMGVDDTRNGVMMHVSTAWMKTNEVTPTIGDLAVLEGIEYEILSIVRLPENYAANFNVPLFYTLYCERFVHGE